MAWPGAYEPIGSKKSEGAAANEAEAEAIAATTDYSVIHVQKLIPNGLNRGDGTDRCQLMNRVGQK